MRKLSPSVGACTVDPSLPESAEPVFKTDAIDRFREVVVGAEGESGRRIRFDGHDDDGHVGERGIGSKPSQELLAAPVGEPQVEDDSQRTSSGERVFGAGEVIGYVGSRILLDFDQAGYKRLDMNLVLEGELLEPTDDAQS